MAKKIHVKSFVRKDGTKVKGFTKSAPKLTQAQRQKRARRAKTKLVPAAIKAAGKRGFTATEKALEGKEGITNPKKLAGWLKHEAYKRHELSPEHKYVGRKGYRKHKISGKPVTYAEWKKHHRKKK